MNTATAKLQEHPQYITYFSTKQDRNDSIKLKSIDRMWGFFKALPSHSLRIEKANAVSQRMDARCSAAYLPPRKDFETTVDYYEAALPLGMASRRFTTYFERDDCMRGVHKALETIMPRLFN